MKEYSAIALPIDFGHTDDGKYTPKGQKDAPQILLQALRKAGLQLRQTVEVPVDVPQHHEPSASPLKFDAEIAQAIGDAVGFVENEILDGKIPLILGGDHCISLATALGVSKTLKRQRLGAIVFDAHTDFNKPGEVAKKGLPIAKGQTFSGNAHGMIHALLARQGDEAFQLAKLCKEYSLFDPARVVILGVRSQRYPDLDETLTHLGPKLISAESVMGMLAMNPEVRAHEFTEILSVVSAKFTQPFYLSFDCDAITPDEFPAVATAVAKGLTFEGVKTILDVWRSDYRFWQNLRAVDIAEYCPNLDPGHVAIGSLATLISGFLNLDQPF